MFRTILIFFIFYQMLTPRVSSALERPEELPGLVRASIQCVVAFAALKEMNIPDNVLNSRGLTGHEIGRYYVNIIAPWQHTMAAARASHNAGLRYGDQIRQGRLNDIIQAAQGCVNSAAVGMGR
jgi:hypothetical protein